MSDPMDHVRKSSCGHTWTLRHTACPECFAALRAENEALKGEVERLTRERDGWIEDARLRAQNEVFWREQHQAAEAALESLRRDVERMSSYRDEAVRRISVVVAAMDGRFVSDEDEREVPFIGQAVGLRRAYLAAEVALAALRGEVREVLTKVEWQGDITEAAGEPGCCPACIMDYAGGHAPDCRLAALLKRVGP